MLKIMTFAFVFVAGVAFGGGFRYAQVEAQLSDLEVQNVMIPNAGAPMGAPGGGTCS